MYVIAEYSKKQAKKLGVEIEPSTRKNKKIDVYKDGKKIASIGDTRYDDYATLIKTDPELAKKKQRLYYLRHTGKTLGETLARTILW